MTNKLVLSGSVVALSLLTASVSAASSQESSGYYQGRSWADVEAKVSSILDNMSQSEKYQFIRVDDGHMIPTNHRFGIEGTVAYDSTMGVYVNKEIFGASYPSQTMLAATWNIQRAKQLGKALGYETRIAGGEQLLSPVVNLYRTPLNGRAAESVCGEDPYLCSVMAPAITNGIQVQGVQAGAKHLVANEQDANRQNLDVRVDERTLREMYLVPFESLVKNADIAALMCGFNKVNGDYACENHHVITDIVKGEWGYQGFVLSDFNSVKNSFEGAWAGTDLDMPSGLKFTENELQPYVNSGQLHQDVIDDKVKRNLRALVRYGFDERTFYAQSLDHPEYGQEAALQTAREGIVLLKNHSRYQGQILPLDKSARIAVVGNAAQQAPSSPFGTANSDAKNGYVSELAGLKQLNVNPDNVTFIDSMSLNPSKVQFLQPSCMSDDTDCAPGVTVEYYNNHDFAGTPSLIRRELGVNFNWATMTNDVTNPCTQAGSEATGIDCSAVPEDAADGSRQLTEINPQNGAFSVRVVGSIRPVTTGPQVLKVRADGAFKVFLDDQLMMESDGVPRAQDVPNAVPVTVKTPRLKAGKLYNVRVEYQRQNRFQVDLGGLNGLQFSWAALNPPQDIDQYDAVIAVVGRNYEYEGEGMDPSYDLPDQQQIMLKKLTKANANTVVVMHGGGGMNMMPWNKKAAGVLHAFYSGQFGGQALAEILYGDVNPSGRLPISLDKKFKFNPSYPSYHDRDAYVGDDAKTSMTYSEGLFLGYRGYLESKHKPLYPFGFGLSYTDFNYSGLTLSDRNVKEGTMYATFSVTNTGARAGYAVPQLYIAPKNAQVERPKRELKGFDKVYLEAGETKQVTIALNARSFAHYVQKTDSWDVDKGNYKILIGDSAQNMLLRKTMHAKHEIVMRTSDSNPLAKPVQDAVKVAKSESYFF